MSEVSYENATPSRTVRKVYYPNKIDLMMEENGLRMPDGSFLADGETIFYDAAGQVESRREYKAGKLHGEWLNYEKSTGEISSKMTFVNGRMTICENFNIEGDLVEKIVFIKPETSQIFSYYAKGQVKEKKTYQNGVMEGEFVQFSKSGLTLKKGTFSKGKKSGEWYIYKGNGLLQTKGHYKDDVKDGEWTYFQKKGMISLREVYNNGVKDGIWMSFYENGQIRERGFYRHDNKVGEWLSYNEDGTLKKKEAYYDNGCLKESGGFENGLKSGEWRTFYEDGQLQEKQLYKEGQKSGECFCMHKNGSIKSFGMYKEDKCSGRWCNFDERACLTQEDDYEDDHALSEKSKNKPSQKAEKSALPLTVLGKMCQNIK